LCCRIEAPPARGKVAQLGSYPYFHDRPGGVVGINTSSRAASLDWKTQSEVLIAALIPSSKKLTAVRRLGIVAALKVLQRLPDFFKHRVEPTWNTAVDADLAQRFSELPAHPTLLDVLLLATDDDLCRFEKDALTPADNGSQRKPAVPSNIQIVNGPQPLATVLKQIAGAGEETKIVQYGQEVNALPTQAYSLVWLK